MPVNTTGLVALMVSPVAPLVPASVVLAAYGVYASFYLFIDFPMCLLLGV